MRSREEVEEDLRDAQSELEEAEWGVSHYRTRIETLQRELDKCAYKGEEECELRMRFLMTLTTMSVMLQQLETILAGLKSDWKSCT